MFNIYAIESLASKLIYIGHTADIDQRLKYHNSGYVKSTAQDRPWILVAIEKIENKNEARWLERTLKKSRGKRLKWLVKNRIKE
jgi:putative endonuclease